MHFIQARGFLRYKEDNILMDFFLRNLRFHINGEFLQPWSFNAEFYYYLQVTSQDSFRIKLHDGELLFKTEIHKLIQNQVQFFNFGRYFYFVPSKLIKCCVLVTHSNICLALLISSAVFPNWEIYHFRKYFP